MFGHGCAYIWVCLCQGVGPLSLETVLFSEVTNVGLVLCSNDHSGFHRGGGGWHWDFQVLEITANCIGHFADSVGNVV